MATVQTPLQPTPMQAIELQARLGPNAGLAFQRSQYLAQALQALETDARENTRTPTALGANLLAEALMQWGRHKADVNAMAAYQRDRDAQDNALLAGTPADPNAAPPSQAPEPAPAPDANAPPPPQAPAPASAPAQAAASAPPLSDVDRINLARMVYGEARGEPPIGQQAVAAVALNRAHESGKSLADILMAPHQFAGMNRQAMAATPAQLQPILANIAPALAGQDPTNGADHFFNPQLANPSWGAGPGQMIGQHKFMALNDQGPGGPMPAPAIPQAVPPPQPYQVAANGPTPPPPQQPPPPLPAGPPPASVLPPSAGAGGPGGPPLQVVTPQEWQTAAALLHDPRTRELGIQEILKLKMKAASPVDAPKNMAWDPKRGRYVPLPGTETTQLPGASPSDQAQRDAFGNVTHATIPGVQGPLPEGMVRDPSTGGYVRTPTQQVQTFRIPGASGLFAMGPNGQPVKVADDQYGPEQLFNLRKQVLDSDQYKNFLIANDAWGAMKAAANQPNGGMRAYALRDTFARLINPGAVARVGTIAAIKESQGIPANIKAFFMNLQGDGNVPPEIAQQIMDVSQGFLTSHYSSAKALNDSNAAYARRHRIDPQDVTAPLPEIDARRFVITRPQATATAATAAGPSPAAIQAEIARRKAAGVWTGR